MHRLVSLKNNINPKEYDLLLNVLSEYEINPDKIERVRSIYKVTQGEKNFCLKRTGNGDKKAKKGMLLVTFLKQKGFDNVAEYIKTKDNKEFVKTKRSIFYLTEWIHGRECDLENINELREASKLLARFHIESNGFNPHGVRIESNLKNWPLMLQNCKKDLDSYRLFIENKKVQTTFDLEYYNFIKDFKDHMDTAINLLRKSNYLEISKKSRESRSLCHDSFYYQNILVSDSGEMHLIDLDSTLYDIHVYDLAKFIRRILYKKIYGWQFEVAKDLIGEYTSVNPLTLEEYEILLAFIIFPHKYWKLGRKRYVKKKKWNEDKYRKKLKNIIKYVDRQKEFIDDFLEYYKISI